MAALLIASLLAGLSAAAALILNDASVAHVFLGYCIGENIGLLLAAAANFAASDP